MKILLFLILFPILLLGCGRVPQPLYNQEQAKEYKINPYFNPMIAQFKKDADMHNVNYGDFEDIKIIDYSDNIDKGQFSICYFGDKKSIFFSKKVTDMSYENQYRLFLHEIGHCAYGLKHDMKYGDSLMSEFFFMLFDNEYNQLHDEENTYFNEVRRNINR